VGGGGGWGGGGGGGGGGQQFIVLATKPNKVSLKSCVFLFSLVPKKKGWGNLYRTVEFDHNIAFVRLQKCQ